MIRLWPKIGDLSLYRIFARMELTIDPREEWRPPNGSHRNAIDFDRSNLSHLPQIQPELLLRSKKLGGNMHSSAIGWEDNLASDLVDDPEVPLIQEATRQPHPPIPPPPGNGGAIWGRMRDRARGASKADSGVDEAVDEESVLVATVRIEPCRSAELAAEPS